MNAVHSQGSRSLEGPLKAVQETLHSWKEETGRDYWRSPLVAAASAEDPLFAELKTAVGPDHAMPGDLLESARSVVAFFLPFKRSLGRDNDAEPFYACRDWAEAYVETNRLIARIGDDLSMLLDGRAVSTPATHNFDEERLVSGWSHRHVAFIAGLGTLGRNNLLVTRAGCCGRLGTVVTDADLPVTPRPRQQWCLEKAGLPCEACLVKCRYDALTKDGFDRHACYRQLMLNDACFADLPLTDVCGKCSCELPCSYEIPRRLQREES